MSRSAAVSGRKGEFMTAVVRFGVLPIFRGLGGKLKPLRVIDALTNEQAQRKAEVFASVVGGAIAFSKAGDPELGQWGTPRIISRHGEVPEGIEISSLDDKAAQADEA